MCIFAYGQTGSGKTYTMVWSFISSLTFKVTIFYKMPMLIIISSQTGPNKATKENWGVNYRALNDLFDISQKRKTSISYEIGVQMIEIYNEQVRDLLSSDGTPKKYPFNLGNVASNEVLKYYCILLHSMVLGF